jgi:hypothetical protein
LGEFIHVHGIATDSQGNVYAVDETKRQIQKFDSNGTFITAWGGATEPTAFLSSKLEDVDVDLQDNVYVVDYGRRTIYKYDSNGTFLTGLGTNGTSEGMLSRSDITNFTNSSAFPILIPGNNLPNEVQSDSENNDDLDAFGIKKLYPTELGGREWVAKWDNGHPRTILDRGVDPCDPELHITHMSNQEIGFKGYLEIGGDGTARVSAHSGRLYIFR